MPKPTRILAHKKSTLYPGFIIVTIDPKVKGCEFMMKEEPVYTSEHMAIVYQDERIYAQANLMDTIVGKTPYWLIYYSFHLDEFFAWAKKDSFDLDSIKQVVRCCASATITLAFSDTPVDMSISEQLSLYVEGRLPGIRILEFGELPNGIMSSDLVTDVDEVLGLFLGETKEKDKMPSNIDTSIIDELVATDTEQARKQRHKRKTKQEKRQKNWSRAKKGKADS